MQAAWWPKTSSPPVAWLSPRGRSATRDSAASRGHRSWCFAASSVDWPWNDSSERMFSLLDGWPLRRFGLIGTAGNGIATILPPIFATRCDTRRHRAACRYVKIPTGRHLSARDDSQWTSARGLQNRCGVTSQHRAESIRVTTSRTITKPQASEDPVLLRAATTPGMFHLSCDAGILTRELACWSWFLPTLIQPERRVPIGHQACVGNDAEHPAVKANDEIEQRSRVAVRE